MQNWEYKNLEEVCEINIGRTPERGTASNWDKNKETNNVWLSIADLNNSENGYISDSTEYVSDKAVPKMKLVRANTLLMSFKLTIGRCAITGVDLYTNEAIAALPIKNENELDLFYLKYYLEMFDWNKLTEGDVKVKGKTLNKEKLKTVPVLLPSLEEQKRIVKILDEKFAQLETVKANAKANLQNAKDLFQSQLTKVFSNTTWEKKRFEELFKLKSGDYLNSKSVVKGDYPIYGGNGIIDYHKEFNLDGDNIIIGRVGALCGNVRYLSEPIWLTDNAFKLSFIDFEYDYKFITYLLNHLNLRSYARQAAQPVISNSSLKDIEIPLPPLLEQKSIVEQLDSLSEKVRSLEEIYTKQLANCDELKQAFLAKAFAGEL